MEKFQRRTDDLIVQYIGEEAVIYDERTHQAFCLNAVTTAVWLLCNGGTWEELVADAAEVPRLLGAEVDLILAELQHFGILLGEPVSDAAEPVKLEHSRRVLMTRFAAGAVMALPFIAAIVAPPAAMAYKGCTVKVGGICVLDQQGGSQAQVRRVRRRSSED